MIDREELLEWADVHGEKYGTPASYVEEAAARGQHVMLDIDVQGALQVQARTDDPILIFILPPSMEVLLSRLKGRGTESLQQLERRLRNARAEIARASEFDYLVVNDDIERSVEAVRVIAKAHQETLEYRMRPVLGHSTLIEDLTDGLDRVLFSEFASQDT